MSAVDTYFSRAKISAFVIDLSHTQINLRMKSFIPIQILRMENSVFYVPGSYPPQLHSFTPRSSRLLMPRELSTIPEVRDASGLFADIEAADFENVGNDAGDVIEMQFHPASTEMIDPPSLDSTIWSRNPAAYFPLDLRELEDSASSSGLSDSESGSDILTTAAERANDISPGAARLALGVTFGVTVGGGVAIGVIFGTSRETSSSHGNSNGSGDDCASADDTLATPVVVTALPADTGAQIDMPYIGAIADTLWTRAGVAGALASGLRLDIRGPDFSAQVLALAAFLHDVEIIATGVAALEWHA